MSANAGVQNPCPLRKCKFLCRGEKCFELYEEKIIFVYMKKKKLTFLLHYTLLYSEMCTGQYFKKETTTWGQYVHPK